MAIESDAFLGIRIHSTFKSSEQPKCEIIGHLNSNMVDITVGAVTSRLNKDDFAKFMQVAREIEERLDIKKMENLL